MRIVSFLLFLVVNGIILYFIAVAIDHGYVNINPDAMFPMTIVFLIGYALLAGSFNYYYFRKGLFDLFEPFTKK